jgi:hypothetical protein
MTEPNATTVTPAPVLLTQHTALALLGLTPRRYLESVKALGIRHRRVGKLVLTSPGDWAALLPGLEAPASTTPDKPSPGGVDGVLAAIGRRRAG